MLLISNYIHLDIQPVVVNYLDRAFNKQIKKIYDIWFWKERDVSLDDVILD